MSARNLKPEDWEFLARKTEFQPVKLALAVSVTPLQLQRILPTNTFSFRRGKDGSARLEYGFENEEFDRA